MTPCLTLLSLFLPLILTLLAAPVGAMTARPDSSGCHKIFLKNGDSLVVAVERITSVRILYRKCGAPNRPVESVDKYRVASVYDPTGQLLFKGGEVRAKKGSHEPHALASMAALVLIPVFAIIPLGFLLTPLLAGAACGLGIASLARFRKYPGKYRGKFLAWLGLVLGAVIFVGFVFLIIIAIATLFN